MLIQSPLNTESVHLRCRQAHLLGARMHAGTTLATRSMWVAGTNLSKSGTFVCCLTFRPVRRIRTGHNMARSHPSHVRCGCHVAVALSAPSLYCRTIDTSYGAYAYLSARFAFSHTNTHLAAVPSTISVCGTLRRQIRRMCRSKSSLVIMVAPSLACVRSLAHHI